MTTTGDIAVQYQDIFRRARTGETTTGTADNTPTSALVTRFIDDVEELSVEWLAPGYIPKSMLTMLVGDPGSGKSYLAQNIAASVCGGSPMFGTYHPEKIGTVLYLCGEDDVARTLKPRLRGAHYPNNNKFVLVEGVNRGEEGKGAFHLGRDVRHLDERCTEIGDVQAIIVDTLDVYIGGLDGNKAEDARTVTTPLAELAEKHNLSVIAIRHLNKTIGLRAIHKIVGSVSWVGAARAVYLVGTTPDDEELRYFLPVKLNIARKPEPLGFRIHNGYRLTWEQVPGDITADDLVRADKPGGDNDRTTPIDDVIGWLSAWLADGPRLAADSMNDAEARGFKERTVKRAKRRLNVICRPLQLDGDECSKWYWALSQNGHKGAS